MKISQNSLSKKDIIVVLDKLSNPVLLSDRDKFIFANSEAIQLFGLKFESIVDNDYLKTAFLNKIEDDSDKKEFSLTIDLAFDHKISTDVVIKKIKVDKGDLFIIELHNYQKIKEINQLESTYDYLQIQNIWDEFCDVVFLLDCNMKIRKISPSVKKHLGYLPDEIVGKKISFLYSKAYYDDCETSFDYLVSRFAEIPFYKSCLDEEIVQVELQDKDKRSKPFEINFRLQKKGAEKYMLGIARDITYRLEDIQITNIYRAVSLGMMSNNYLSDLYQIIKNELSKIVDTTNFIIALYNKEEQQLDIPLMVDTFDDFQSVSLKNTISAIVIKNKEPLLVDEDEIIQLEREGKIRKVGSECKQWLGIPLITNDEVLGILILQSYTNKNAYNQSHVRMLELISNQLALAIKQKHMQNELKVSKDNFELIGDKLPGIIFIYDYLPDGNRKTIYYSSGLEKLIDERKIAGVNPVEKFFTMIHEDDKKKFANFQVDNENVDFKYRLVNGDKITWVRSISTSIPQKNNVMRVIGILLDITESEKTLDAYKISERNLKQVIEQSPNAIQIHSSDGHLIEVNQAWKRLFETDDFLSNAILEDNYFFGQEFHSSFEMALQGSKVSLQRIRLQLDSGTSKWVNSHFYPIYGQTGVENIIITSEDITEQIKAQEMLAENEKKFRLIVETASDAIFIYDEVGRIIECNNTACRIYGYTKEEMFNLYLSDLVPERFKSKVDNRIEFNKLNYKKPVERINIKKDRTEFTVEVFTKLVRFNNEPRLIAFARDITERKKIEEKLTEAQKMDSIGNLAGGVAHDFNNMLGGISGFASLLEIKESDPEKLKLINGISKAVARSADLTSKLLAFGRKGKNLNKAVNMNDVIEEVLGIIENTISKGIEIELYLDDDLYFVDADPSQMNQVILNLCVNAVEAMNNKKGILSLKTENIDIKTSHFSHFADIKPGKYVCLTIADTGYGIDKETQKKMFEPFFTTKEDGDVKGTGLGLSTVYGIVANHKGFVDVSSKINFGTKFYIYLPRGKKKSEEKSGNRKLIKKPLKKISVLVVEDEEINRKVLAEMLETLGCDVFSAENGAEGLEIFRKHHQEIDLVFLDMIMPVMDGKEAFEQMKLINPDVNSVLVTGFGHNKEAEEMMRMGVKQLLAKPFDLEMIKTVLSDIDLIP